MTTRPTKDYSPPLRAPSSVAPDCVPPPLCPYVPSSLRPSRRGASRHAFTLIELIVVIGIISVLAVSVLPIIAGMWRDNRSADASNRLNGLIRSARMRAIGGKETGLFFFVESGVQRVVFIEAEPPTDPVNDVPPHVAADRFLVLEGNNLFDLPPPFRVTPLAVLARPENAQQDRSKWNDDELANQDYADTDLIFNSANIGAQNHRNFFTIIFSPEGGLTKRKVVLIHDPEPDVNAADGQPGEGKVTLLQVGDVGNFEGADGGEVGLGGGMVLSAMVYAGSGGSRQALNFPSVDGLLVYDDSSFEQFADSDEGNSPDIVSKREYLKQSGEPLYISWQTGAIVRGPTGP